MDSKYSLQAGERGNITLHTLSMVTQPPPCVLPALKQCDQKMSNRSKFKQQKLLNDRVKTCTTRQLQSV